MMYPSLLGFGQRKYRFWNFKTLSISVNPQLLISDLATNRHFFFFILWHRACSLHVFVPRNSLVTAKCIIILLKTQVYSIEFSGN